jgi:hypothetical protein
MVGKNIAVTANNYNSGQNPDFVDHCGRPIRYDSRIAGIKNGIPRVSVISRGRGRATIVKANEGRQDARCGRCLQRAA